MMLDFPIAADPVTATDADSLRDALTAFPAVRLIGSGSAQGRMPAPVDAADGSPVTLVSTAGMNRILRLETDDLTCSVEPGVRRADLDGELASRGLWLPCASGSGGTLGGLFAADECGPQGPGQPEARGLLLGMTAMLACGKVFRSGARVVKNVAGFDLQKLFVGSRGQLFAVTELHLKLRPLPRARLDFVLGDLELDLAIERLRNLRTQPTRPAVLHLHRTEAGGYAITGSLHGEPRVLGRLRRELGCAELKAPLDPSAVWSEALAVPPSPGSEAEPTETLVGVMRFGRLPELLRKLSASARFALLGERFVLRASSSEIDAILTRLPELDGAGEILRARPDRRGRATPENPAAARLRAGLRAALDPGGVLR